MMQVSQVVLLVKNQLELEYANITVIGEIENYKQHVSGHKYFALKDSSDTINAVCWRGIKHKELSNGMQVICTGKLSIFRSSVQFIISTINIAGIGRLSIDYKQLEDKLRREGLFDRKRTIPKFIKRLGVIVGKDSQAAYDIQARLTHKLLDTVVYRYSLVQGEQALIELIASIQALDGTVDTIIIARGGGSKDDLSVFNKEELARAAFACSTPIVTAIGHESDTSLLDLVSDLQTSTPTASIEVLFPNRAHLLELVTQLQPGLDLSLQQLQAQIIQLSDKLEQALSKLHDHKHKQLPTFNITKPVVILPKLQQLVQSFYQRKQASVPKFDISIAFIQSQLQQLNDKLESLAFVNVMSKGFAIIEDQHGQMLKHASNLRSGHVYKLRFKDSTTDIVKALD